MPDPSFLFPVETLLLRAGLVAACALAAWSALQCAGRDGGRGAGVGEAVWTAVAILVLAAVVASVRPGGPGAV